MGKRFTETLTEHLVATWLRLTTGPGEVIGKSDRFRKDCGQHALVSDVQLIREMQTTKPFCWSRSFRKFHTAWNVVGLLLVGTRCCGPPSALPTSSMNLIKCKVLSCCRASQRCSEEDPQESVNAARSEGAGQHHPEFCDCNREPHREPSSSTGWEQPGRKRPSTLC